MLSKEVQLSSIARFTSLYLVRNWLFKDMNSIVTCLVVRVRRREASEVELVVSSYRRDRSSDEVDHDMTIVSLALYW